MSTSPKPSDPSSILSSVLPLLFARREYFFGAQADTRVKTSQVIKGTKSGLDRGPDEGDW